MTPQMLLQMLMSGQRGAAPPNQLGAPPVQPIRQFGRRAQQSAQEVPQSPMQMMGRTPQAPQTIDPRLTGRTGLSDLLLGTGLGMMAQSDTPGQSFLGNVGRSLPMGIQMRDQARQGTALSDVMRGAPGSMQRLTEIAPQIAMELQETQASLQGEDWMEVGGHAFNRRTGKWELAPQEEADPWDGYNDRFRQAAGAAMGPDWEPSLGTQKDFAAIDAHIQRQSESTAAAAVAGPEGAGFRYYDKVIDEADNAASTMPQLATMRGLLEGGMSTGGMADITLGLRSIMWPVLGLDGDNLSDQQVFNAISSRLALMGRSEMPGQLSDNDIKFLTRMKPNLQNTRDGNMLLITILERMARRKADLAYEADMYVDEHGEADRGLRRHLIKYANDNDMFGDLGVRAPF